MAINYDDFRFLSAGPTDRRVYFITGARNVTANSFSTFDINHTVTEPFVPIIRYTPDGGTTWYYGGDSMFEGTATGATMNAEANSSLIRVYVQGGPVFRTLNYEIYGIATNV